MLQFNIPDEQYILSLDTLHFDVLRQYLLTPTEERRPLWCAPHKESVYYQVTIASEEDTDEGAFIEPSKSYLCYICNVDVPEKYYKQHNESEKHQLHKKLTGKILENVAKQINIDINTSNNYENNEYYCESCCKVVAVKHKRKHMKSNYHLKSIENEQLTSKFLELYLSKENPGSDSETDNDYKSKVDNSILDNGTNDSKTHTESKCNEYVMAQVLKNIIKSNDDVPSAPYEKDTIFTDFKIYLEEIIEIYGLPRNMPILEDNFVVIVTPKGYREYISIDNFHGYSRNGTYVYCLLCQMWVQNIIEEHAYSQQHATRLMQPVNDKFARILAKMLQFNIPDEQYILSLDTLPFDVLRQYLLTPTEERRPLWCAPHKESVYYQVTIASEEDTDEEAFIEPSKSYLCYICNVDVPEKYYKQHNESEKHQLHKKLTGKILENVAKQINIDINTSNNYENNEYYCESCCKVVAVKHKRKHMKSNYHLKSIENEQLTSKFLELYLSKENPGSDSETDNDYKSKVDNSILDNGTNDSKTHTESKCNEYVMAQVLKNIIKNNDDVPSAPYEKDTIFTDFKIYLEEIIEIYGLPRNMPILEDNFVVIVTPKGYREYISIDNFHGYSRNGTYVYCLLCQMWVQNIIEEHAYSQQHATRLMQPVNDKFARILDEKYSHCLLCNARVLTASDHTAKCSKYRNNTESTSASSTNHEEPSTSSEIPSVEVPEKINDNKKQQKFIAYKKQFCYLDEGSSKCLVCLVSVNKARSSIIRHVEGIPHIKNCDVLLKNNNIKQVSFEQYFCKICNVNILDFINHINMHKQEKSDLVKRNGEKLILKRYVYEDPLNDDPIAKKYRHIYVNQLKRNKIVQKTESKFYCNICFINVTRISEIDHMFGERHRYYLNSPNGS